MKSLSELSNFIESESFGLLDQSTQIDVVAKLNDQIKAVCDVRGISLPEEERLDEYEYQWTPRQPDLHIGLVPIVMPDYYELKWILGGDIQGLIPIVRANGKYGLFRPSFMGMGMGVNVFYSVKNPFKYDDVRISVPAPGWGDYFGYLAVCKDAKWSVMIVDIDTHPLTFVEGCNSFKEARQEMEAIIGGPSPYDWVTFDEFAEPATISSVSSDDNQPNVPNNAKAKRSASIPFKVTFPDGTVFDDKKAVKTFISALVKIGLDRVQQVGIRHAGYNLVSDTPRPTVGANTWQEQVKGKYIYTKLSNDAKMADLMKISNYYNINLIIQ